MDNDRLYVCLMLATFILALVIIGSWTRVISNTDQNNIMQSECFCYQQNQVYSDYSRWWIGAKTNVFCSDESNTMTKYRVDISEISC